MKPHVRRKYVPILLLVASSCWPQPKSNAVSHDGPVAFRYQLPMASRTSAGVFDQQGHLIKTLWSGRAEGAGWHGAEWDGIDENGHVGLRSDHYSIHVLSNNVRYTWDGLIGNTESAWTTSSSIWDGIGYDPRDTRILCDGIPCWVTGGYAEGTSNLFRISSIKPNSPTEVSLDYRDQNVKFVDGDYDGSRLYLANSGSWFGESFVTVMDEVDGKPASFTTGHWVNTPFSWKKVSLNVIDEAALKSSQGVGAIAVQDQRGALLAVAHPKDAEIVFFNKITGELVGSPIHGISAQSMGFTHEGLWVHAGSAVYLISDPSGKNEMSSPLPGLSSPVYLTTNKTANRVYVLDGGTSQQVKIFSNKVLVDSYGKKGGYTDWDPTITNDRLLIDNTATSGQPTPNGSWIKVSRAGELWICDGGNAYRILHISSKGKYLGQILFSQGTYSLAASRTDPTRVFRGLIEYRMNYSQPLRPGDPSLLPQEQRGWDMVRNWEVGAIGAHGSTLKLFKSPVHAGFVTVERLSNSRYYGQLVDDTGIRWEVELPLSGHLPLRYTGAVYSRAHTYMLQEDGSIALIEQDRRTVPFHSKLMVLALNGFDSQGNPVRSSHPELKAEIKYAPQSEPPFDERGGWGMSAYLTPTVNGVYPAYLSVPTNQDHTTSFPHLAGVRTGDETYIFHSHPERCMFRPDFKGGFPCKSGYGEHAGIGAQALGNFIFTAYDGQYSSWGNTFCQFSEDGLLIGQFGQFDAVKDGELRGPGLAGNIAVARFVMFGGNDYLYITSEGGHTPAQRWKIDNLQSVIQFEGSAQLGQSIVLSQRIPESVLPKSSR